MTPRDFEEYVCDIYRKQGYNVELTPLSGDYGIDLFAIKKKEKIAIQVKMYGGTARKVNRQCVMELHGAKDYFDCTKAVIVTNGAFLNDVYKVADKLKIELIQLGKVQLSKSVKKNSKITFEDIWLNHILPLQGKIIVRPDGKTNSINQVDWSGIERTTSTGKKGMIKIEIFKEVINKLLTTGRITRDEINQNYLGRASSGIVLILTQVPFFELTQKPTGLSYKEFKN